MSLPATGPDTWLDPTVADLAAIDAEWHLIAAELAAVDRLIAWLTGTDPAGEATRPAGPVVPLAGVRRAG